MARPEGNLSGVECISRTSLIDRMLQNKTPGEVQMWSGTMQVLRREPLMEYVLRDGAGRDIGRVLAPPGGLRTGPGAETVLLRRVPAARRSPLTVAA